MTAGRIVGFLLAVSLSSSLGEHAESNDLFGGFMKESLLSMSLQPNDVDSGAYDDMFLVNDTDNEVITQHGALVANGSLCARDCDGTTRTCYYRFVIEQYSAMGSACDNCICANAACTRVADCNNPNCITADGVPRNMITVNKRYPGPPIYVCKGDRVIVDVTNLLQGKVASLHWHGIFQKGTPWMDGVTMVSQCPIVPGTSFRYDFVASEPGTHFWHDHAGMIKVDGVQGPLIVREPRSVAPITTYYDYDLPSHTVFLTDWKHFMSDDEFPIMKEFPGKRMQALLINGKGLFEDQRIARGSYYYSNYGVCTRSPVKTFEVERGHSYRFRIIGAFCMMCAVEFQIENHDLTVIAVDGNPVIPATVTSLVITSGERYDIVINTFNSVNYYWIHTRGVSPCQGTSQSALLVYKGATARRNCVNPQPLLKTLNHPNLTIDQSKNIKIMDLHNGLPVPQYITNPQTPTSKYTFVVSSHSYTLEELLDPRPQLFFKPFANGQPFRSTINNVSSTMPSSPLYTQLSDVPESQYCSEQCINGESETACAPCVHLVKIPQNQTVDFIIADPGNYTGIVHPFHLHGHKFYVLEQGMMGGDVTVQSLRAKLDAGNIDLFRPPIKDTIIVPLGTYAIIRFFSDNPGFWIFHCHYVYHNAVGMHVFLQVGDPSSFPSPPQNYPTCGNYLPNI